LVPLAGISLASHRYEISPGNRLIQGDFPVGLAK
jgi:hypothetical protein